MAARRYGIPLPQWLDLSTGINPRGWPVPAVPERIWQRLPEDEDGLAAAARGYYQAPALLPVAGSQVAVQALPELRPACRVGILSPGYQEHAAAWSRAGHQVLRLAPEQIDHRIPQLDLLVLIHPNNPTGALFQRQQLLAWRQQLAGRGGWLVVDEAFIDSTPERSLAADSALPGLIVLRSLGKFFGLAGARVGFVLAAPELLEGLRERLGPWALSGPSRWIATQALQDRRWQCQTRRWLARQAAELAGQLRAAGLRPAGGSALFQWVVTPEAERIHRRLAEQGILTRLFREPASLRFGLPGCEAAQQRLCHALQRLHCAS